MKSAILLKTSRLTIILFLGCVLLFDVINYINVTFRKAGPEGCVYKFIGLFRPRYVRAVLGSVGPFMKGLLRFELPPFNSVHYYCKEFKSLL